MCARRVLKAGLGDDTLTGPTARQPKIIAGLFADPMPDRVEPCLALLSEKAPSGPEWAFEVKWDGYRVAVHIEPGQKIRILTRGGHDWTHRFPSIAADAALLDVESAIVDGEAVVLNERGTSDFGALQRALGGRGGRRFAAEAILYAFDLLFLNGYDVRDLALAERRHMLEQVLPSSGAILFSAEVGVDADVATFLDSACQLGLEGIIAKRRSAPYRSGRGGDWLKIKCTQSQGFFIIGYEPSAAALGGIRRLLLAARKGSGLAYVGSVGTGFTQLSATTLRRLMDPLLTTRPAANMVGRRKRGRWIRPELVAEIEFRAWTDDGKLRHASFKGLREEADEASVYHLG